MSSWSREEKRHDKKPSGVCAWDLNVGSPPIPRLSGRSGHGGKTSGRQEWGDGAPRRPVQALQWPRARLGRRRTRRNARAVHPVVSPSVNLPSCSSSPLTPKSAPGCSPRRPYGQLCGSGAPREETPRRAQCAPADAPGRDSAAPRSRATVREEARCGQGSRGRDWSARGDVSARAGNASPRQGAIGPAGVTYHQVAKILELQLQPQSFQSVFRVDFLYD